MMGWIVLAIIVLVECGMMGYSILHKKNIKIERAVIRISVLGVAVLAAITGIITWYFSVIGMYFVLFLLAIYSALVLIKHAKRRLKVSDYTPGRTIHHAFQMIVLLGFSVLPILLFPPFKPLETTGQYKSKTTTYTWTDKSRQETLSEIPEPRNVTVEFYYPVQYKDGTTLAANETFPLIAFSHGAFGIIDSNCSLFEDLASNGYIVCSICHTYQAFYTEEADGSIKLANMNFIQESLNSFNGLYEPEQEKELEDQWLAVRTGDMNFVLDTIDQMVKEHFEDETFKRIDIDHIGLIGHSLGGATALQTARERSNIDAVVVLDGTHCGEKMDIKNGEWVYNEKPLDVPILDMRSEDHSKSIQQSAKEYANDHTLRIASTGKAVTILGTKHMNFTDFPMFSPFLAHQLGTGTCNELNCTKQIDSIVLQWFNYYIKGNSALEIQDVYEIK